jgi:acyl carrier protein
VEHTQAIKEYLVGEFLPDVTVDELDSDYDLLAGGVIDSLALLMVIAWLEDRFGIAVDALDVTPDDFRTVAAMAAFVRDAPARAAAE